MFYYDITSTGPPTLVFDHPHGAKIMSISAGGGFVFPFSQRDASCCPLPWFSQASPIQFCQERGSFLFPALNESATVVVRHILDVSKRRVEFRLLLRREAKQKSLESTPMPKEFLCLLQSQKRRNRCMCSNCDWFARTSSQVQMNTIHQRCACDLARF